MRLRARLQRPPASKNPARSPTRKRSGAVDSNTLWAALAMVLVAEGLLPFLSPGGWRRMFTQMLQLHDGQIRFFGLCSLVAGGLLLWFVV